MMGGNGSDTSLLEREVRKARKGRTNRRKRKEDQPSQAKSRFYTIWGDIDKENRKIGKPVNQGRKKSGNQESAGESTQETSSENRQ